jgi:G3E family GTPase
VRTSWCDLPAHVDLTRVTYVQTVRGMKPLMESSCCDKLSHDHTAHVTSVSLSSHQPMSLPRLQAWLQEMIDANWQDLFRVKGILHIEGDGRRFVVHGVHAELIGDFEPLPHERSSISAVAGDGKLPSAPASPVAVNDTESRMVVIGRHLDAVSLQERFLSCVAREDIGAIDEDTTPAKSSVESKASRLRRRAD